MSMRCAWPRCKARQDRESGVGYYDKWICDKHWARADDITTAELKAIVGVRKGPIRAELAANRAERGGNVFI